jgi:hypothetical protein
MIYLHCVPIEQIDFCKFFGVESATIHVPRVTLKELEKHKDSHSSSRTRNRSRSVLSFIEEKIADNQPVRDGVEIKFVPQFPDIDFAKHDLNPAWNDDVLIATVLQFCNDIANLPTTLITHDTAARLTCRHLKIDTCQLDDKYKLPAELDETEKENQRLKRQIQKIENSMPKIVVGFAEDYSDTARFQIKPPDEIDENSIATTMAAVRESVPKIDRPPPKPEQEPDKTERHLSALHAKFGGMNRNSIADEEYARYENDRNKYFERYESYLRKQVDSGNVIKRMIRFKIVVLNDGSAPAEDVDVSFHFPDGFSLHEIDELPDLPGEPNPPAEPRTPTEMIQSRIGRFDIGSIGRLNVPSFQPPSSFSKKRSNSYDIEDHSRRIKHGFQMELPELFLIFDSYETARSFNCDYEVRVGNLPDPISGKLNLVIEKP